MTAYLTCGRAESGLWKRMWTAAAVLLCCSTAFAAEALPTASAGAEAGGLVLDEAKMLAKLQRISADPTRLEARVYGYGYYGYGGYPYAAYYGYRPYYGYRSYYPRAYAYPGFYPPAYGSYYATPYYSAAYYAPAVYAAPAVYVAPRPAYYGGYGVGYGYGCAYGGCYHW